MARFTAGAPQVRWVNPMSRRSELARTCNELALDQWGVITMAQALATGMSESAVGRAVSTGSWHRVHSGVYRIAGFLRCWEQDLMAACKWGGASAVASHRSACALLQLGLEDVPVEILLTQHRRSSAGVIRHTTDSLDPVDITRVRGIPVTTPSRTLIDLGSVASKAIVESALETALRTGQTSIAHLIGRLDELGKSGRRGTATIRSVLRDRDPHLAPTESELESLVWRLIVRARLPRPERQVVIADSDGFIGRVDFAYPEQRVVVEAQGARWHSSARAISNDRERRNRLTLAGWRVLEVAWDDVVRRPRHVAASIANALRSAKAA